MAVSDDPSGDHGRKNQQEWPAIRTLNARKSQEPLAYRHRDHAEQNDREDHQYSYRMAGHVAPQDPFKPNLTPLLVSLGHSRSLPRTLNVRKWPEAE